MQCNAQIINSDFENALIKQDQNHRERALDKHTSFIVQAPAGSGKTELLIQRILTLLAHVNKPEEILAITFTKKAANEMRMRLVQALRQAASQPKPALLHAQRTWTLAQKALQNDRAKNWNLLGNPSQLRIQTIDSFCAYLNHQLPLLSHFGAPPHLSDEPFILYHAAVSDLLSHLENDEAGISAIKQLLLHLDNDLGKLQSLLIKLLANRDQWLPYLCFDFSREIHDQQIRQGLEYYFQLIIQAHLQSIRALFPEPLIPDLLSIANYAAHHLLKKDKPSHLTACLNLQALPGINVSDKLIWQGLAELLLTSEGQWRKTFDARNGFPAAEKQATSHYKQIALSLIQQLQEHDALRVALIELRYLPKAHYDDAQWAILKTLVHVLKMAAAELHIVFQQQGQIDFIENMQAALRALGDEESPTDLSLSLDYQITHILVDEFQDTSIAQYKLLEKLTLGWEKHDGRTLFVVGDPMQSIYRFRQAEVGLFLKMRQHGLGAIDLVPLTLTMNFRSAENIVKWNNTHYAAIFPRFDHIANGAVTYSPSAYRPAATSSDPCSDIQVQGFFSADGQAQAQYIVSYIQALRHHAPQENIAILVRSRPHLSAIIPALREAGLAYRAVDIDPLSEKQLIKDLLSLTRALLHPADRIAWLAVLRAPWCGLTLADLHALASSDAHATIPSLLEQEPIRASLSPAGQQALNRVWPILCSKAAERERYTLRYWIESTWMLLGGPACLLDPLENEDVQAYLDRLESLEKNDCFSFDENTWQEKIERIYSPIQHEEAHLQLMTIHSAKGLEFDTVIVPHLEKKIPHDDNPLLLWEERPLPDDQIGLLLAPIHAAFTEPDPLYIYLQRQNKIRAGLEKNRLLYVATTRAKKKLCLLYNVETDTKNQSGVMNPASNSFLGSLWPLFSEQTLSISQIDRLEKSAPPQEKKPFRRLVADWKNFLLDENTLPTLHQQQSGFRVADMTQRYIGIIIHRIIQMISEHGEKTYTLLSPIQQKKNIARQLQQLGLVQHALDQAVLLSHQAIENILQDERGRWLLQPHLESRSEWALSALLDGQAVNLIIDRTFIDEQGLRWIIDYKTSRPTDGTKLNDFLQEEKEKYLPQMQKYAKALQNREDRPIRLGLYFPLVPGWIEWDILA